VLLLRSQIYQASRYEVAGREKKWEEGFEAGILGISNEKKSFKNCFFCETLLNLSNLHLIYSL